MKHRERFFRAILLSLTFNVKDVESTFPWSQELGTEDADLPVRFGVCMDALIVLPERAFDLVWHGYEHLVNEHLQELGTLADELASKPERMTDNPQMRAVLPMLLEVVVPAHEERILKQKTQVH